MTEMILKMAEIVVLNVFVVSFVYLADTSEYFKKSSYWFRQIIIGVIFGLLAIAGTEFGVNIFGATANVRDAAPLCAGLIFGGPAGIIAGLMGGVERWLAVYWGAGAFTRTACSVSTVFAGLMAAFLRKFMFDNKRPTWFYGLATGLVMEVFHMLSIFLTHMDDMHKAYNVVSTVAVPMITANSIAVMISALVVTFIRKKKTPFVLNGMYHKKSSREITQTFQSWLLGCVVVAFLVTCAFSFVIQTRLSENDTDSLLSLNIEDISADVKDASNENMLRLAHSVANQITDDCYSDDNTDGNFYNEKLNELLTFYNIAEINLIDKNGIIVSSTYPGFIGFDMTSGEQSKAFMVLLNGQTEFVQEYMPITYNSSVSMKYAGVKLDNGGFVQIGYDSEKFHRDIADKVEGATDNLHIGENGGAIICDSDWVIVSDRNGYEGKSLYDTGIWINPVSMKEGITFKSDVYGASAICMYGTTEDYYIITFLPESEAMFTRNMSVYITAFMEVILFAMIFVLIYLLVKKLVVNNILKVNESLSQITKGDLNVKVDVRTNKEFICLSDDINSTVDTLKKYIAEASARIDKELEFAKAIQHSALPSIFPPYPNHKEFDIYARMYPAKEVGGDFYDFYFVDDSHLVFVIADVSGKGIPAALVMMTAKTMIKSLAEGNRDIAEVITKTNDSLCENNDSGMFVTALVGVLDVRSGEVQCVNAGHNPPALCRKGEDFNFYRIAPGLVLAGMEGITYKSYGFMLNPGDTFFLYTDGLNEATNSDGELFGNNRLLASLNTHKDMNMEKLTLLAKSDADAFVGAAPQFDDLTMLAIRYNGFAED